MRTRAALIIVSLLAAACGGDPETTLTDTTTTDTTITDTSEPTTTDPPTSATTTAPATTAPSTVSSTDAPTTVPTSAPSDDVLGEELVGRWAHYDVVAYEDGVLKTLIISYGFNDFTLDDGKVIDAASFCFSEQRTDQPIETSLSDAATQAIRPPATPIEATEVDGRLRISRAATPTPVGIRLDDPANESLPTDPTDPRIVDDDGDGQPGITVTIRVSDDLSGELYIARREVFAYEAELVEPDRLVGTVTDDSEQLVIGASDPIFASSDANWAQHPDLTKSPIILVRVEPDWDCARLAAERDDLFPPTPDVDW
ncbi:MAG: hypothetical protein R8G01_05175 [Ilumatobacteraceae bacterium]|nr:hypothetical protein [Ilumatobacteraceae bacterium]